LDREKRYTVFKDKDIYKYLTADEMECFDRVCSTIMRGRIMDNKPLLDCVVVESDWPEYEKVWGMIEARVDAEEKKDA
jgi:hypothetical protein